MDQPVAESWDVLLRRQQIEASESPVADLFRLERSQAWPDIARVVPQLREHVQPDEEPLRRAFESWLQGVVLPRLKMQPEEIPIRLTLEEIETMLAERIDEWNRQLEKQGIEKGMEKGMEKGIQQGIQQGRQEGLQRGEAKALLRLLEKKFGGLDPGTRDHITQADPDLLLDWIDRAATATRLSDIFDAAS